MIKILNNFDHNKSINENSVKYVGGGGYKSYFLIKYSLYNKNSWYIKIKINFFFLSF